ncbi:energy transducer TonB family protein [Sphingomonas sp. PB4P5]|uniref:energy transducer TonB family protein n=1 Tax=Parasphingomonas puruogangriensis TaxID=3096155 RepID=UPI002FC90DFF
MPSQDFSRPIAIGASVVLHVAVGLALLAAALAGPRGGRARADADADLVMIDLAAVPSDSVEPTGNTAGVVRKPIDAAQVKPAAQLHPSEPGGGSTDGGAAAPGPAGNPGRLTIASDTALDGASPSTGAAMDNIRLRLLEHIERYRRYPPEAQRTALEGVAEVHFVMDRDGGVRSAWIEHSSGSRLLDDEAVAAVRRAAPLPPMPRNWPDPLDVTLPIGFSLR